MRKLQLPILIALICFLTLLPIGCQSIGGSPSSATVPASSQIAGIKEDVTKARTDIGAAKDSITQMTPENLPDKKPEAIAKLGSADDRLVDATAKTDAAAKTAKATENKADALTKENASLKAHDPVRDWLNVIGIGAVVISIGLLVAAIFVPFLHALTWLRAACVGALVFGLLLVTIAHFLTQIYWIAGLSLLAAGVGGVIWLLTHKTIAAAKIKDTQEWLKSTQPTTTPLLQKADAAPAPVAKKPWYWPF